VENYLESIYGRPISQEKLKRFSELMCYVKGMGHKIIFGFQDDSVQFASGISCSIEMDPTKWIDNYVTNLDEVPFVEIEMRYGKVYIWMYAPEHKLRLITQKHAEQESFMRWGCAAFDLRDDTDFVLWCQTPLMNNFAMKLRELKNRLESQIDETREVRRIMCHFMRIYSHGRDHIHWNWRSHFSHTHLKAIFESKISFGEF